jgi:hypothetical protein
MGEDEGDVGQDDVCKDVFIRLKRDVKRHEWIETEPLYDQRLEIRKG